MEEQPTDKARSTGPVSATVFKIFPVNMEVGLGSGLNVQLRILRGEKSASLPWCHSTEIKEELVF